MRSTSCTLGLCNIHKSLWPWHTSHKVVQGRQDAWHLTHIDKSYVTWHNSWRDNSNTTEQINAESTYIIIKTTLYNNKNVPGQHILVMVVVLVPWSNLSNPNPNPCLAKLMGRPDLSVSPCCGVPVSLTQSEPRLTEPQSNDRIQSLTFLKTQWHSCMLGWMTVKVQENPDEDYWRKC